MVTIEQIIEKIREYNPGVDVSRVREAFEYSKQHLRGVYRVSGDPALVHALIVTDNLLVFKPDENSILVALLHDICKTEVYNLEEIKTMFGEDVAFLVAGMEKLQSIHLKGSKGDIEAFRRMLLSLAKDLRLVLIRFADLQDDLLSLDFIPQIRRKEIAREMLHVYAPIASRLGIYSVKSQLEDLAIKYLYPDKYEDLRSQMEEYIRKQERFLEKIKKSLEGFLQEQKINGRVEGRLKNLYSIYRKMKKKTKTSMNELYDIFAFRIILPAKYHRNGVENTEKLYTLLGLIHNHWSPLPDRFKDYIAVPKPNGYRSIHTTLIGEGDKKFDLPFEIQIRSEAMHQQAEFGFAAHWLYEDTKGYSTKLDDKMPALGGSQDEKLKRYQEWLKGLASLHAELTADTDQHKKPANTMKLDMFHDQIFAFTPNGEVKSLPAASTPVDFAYAIHTDIGHRCYGAKVNGSIVPLNHQLENGDRVEILTRSKPDPKPHWLSYVKSFQAKSRIKSYFKGLDNERSFKEGKDLINKYLSTMGRPHLDDTFSIFRQYGHNKLSLKERQSLVEDIGNGDVNVAAVLKKVLVSPPVRLQNKRQISQQSAVKKSFDRLQQKEEEILIAGESKFPYKISSCCKPRSGDAIVAYISRGNAVRIHKQHCKFLDKADPERILDASWGLSFIPQNLKPVTVDLKAIDRIGLLRDVAAIIASFNVNILDFTLKERRDNLIHRHMLLEVTSDKQYEKIIKRLRQVRNVLEVNPANEQKKP